MHTLHIAPTLHFIHKAEMQTIYILLLLTAPYSLSKANKAFWMLHLICYLPDGIIIPVRKALNSATSEITRHLQPC